MDSQNPLGLTSTIYLQVPASQPFQTEGTGGPVPILVMLHLALRCYQLTTVDENNVKKRPSDRYRTKTADQ